MNKIIWKNVDDGQWIHIARSNYFNQKLSLHNHDFAEIFWVESGQGVQLFPEKQELLRPGEIYFISPKVVHGFKNSHKEKMTIINIAFPIDKLSILKNKYIELDQWLESDQPLSFQIQDHQHEILKRWSIEISESEFKQIDLECFVLDLIRSFFNQTKDKDHAPQWLIKSLNDFKKEHNLSGGVNRLAQISGYRREYLWKVCQKHYDKSPHELVQEIRFNIAQSKLLLSDEKSLEIALSCGFTNLSHFYREFKKRCNMTPRQFRQKSKSTLA